MSENIRREMHAGKPQNQAIAIAYSVARRSKRKADGGPAIDDSASFDDRFGNLLPAEDLSDDGRSMLEKAGDYIVPPFARNQTSIGQGMLAGIPAGMSFAGPRFLGNTRVPVSTTMPQKALFGLDLATMPGALSSPAEAGEISTDPTPAEQSEISRIQKLIDARRAEMQRGIRPQSNSLAIKGLQDDMDRIIGPNSPLGQRRAAALKLQTSAQSQEQEANMPFQIRHKDYQSNLDTYMPLVSGLSGVLMGKRGNIPRSIIGGMGLGAFEGAGTAAFPTLQDVKALPPGHQWESMADQLYGGKDSPDFWKRIGAAAIEHGLIGGAGGAAGSKVGSFINWLRGARAAPAAVEAATPAVRTPPKEFKVGNELYRHYPDSGQIRVKRGNRWMPVKKDERPKGYASGGDVGDDPALFDDRFQFPVSSPVESPVNPRSISSWPVLPHAPYAVNPKADWPEPPARTSVDETPPPEDGGSSDLLPALTGGGAGVVASMILRSLLAQRGLRGLQRLEPDVVRVGGRFASPNPFRGAIGPEEARRLLAKRLSNTPAQQESGLRRALRRALSFGEPAPKMASGGGTGIPYYESSAIRGIARQGLLNSPVPGRTDKLPINVPSGSYVVPADVVSSLGEGNTHAGGAVLNGMFNPTVSGGGLGGIKKFMAPRTKRPFMPRAKRSVKATYADGGDVPLGFMSDDLPESNNIEDRRDESPLDATLRQRAQVAAGNPPQQAQFAREAWAERLGSKVPIIAAGGEYIIHPDSLVEKYGDLDHAHKIMDAFVKHARAEHIKTLKKLPGPSK